MALPRYPGHDDEMPIETARSRRTNVIIVLALIVLVVVLHLTGVIGQ